MHAGHSEVLVVAIWECTACHQGGYDWRSNYFSELKKIF
jgi:hypothetical protein